MKYYRYVILFFCISGTLFSQQIFPISAFQCQDTTWFNGAGKDSLGLNTIHYTEWPINKDALLAALNAADRESLNVGVGHATKDGYGRDDLHWYCQLYWGQWEAEDASNFWACCWNGDTVIDTFAHNDTALVAYKDSLNACNMLKTHCEHMRQYENTVTYNVIYHLKIDSISMDTLADDVPVCSLYITKVGHIPLIGEVVTADAFDSVNQYTPCILEYDCPKESNQLYYCLYWFDNCDLYCDYIESKDDYIDSLIDEYYNPVLSEITAIYDGHSAMGYYYLLDEPYPSYMAANSHVMEFLRDNQSKPGIQTVSYRNHDSTWFQTYVDSVHPNILPVDYYPLRGERDSALTPEDSGTVFQGRLDTLCMMLEDAREAAMDASIPFWYVCQSFGQYDSATGASYAVREPTPRELRCMIWLGLAHGAQGIDHFLYRSYKEWHIVNGERVCWYDSGLTYNGNPRYPLWTAAKEMNFLLRDIGSKLLTLESDMVFKVSEGIPPDCFIKKVWIWNGTDTLIQIGTFHDNTSDYFIIVNRHCLPEESLEVIVGLEDTLRFLYDCYSKETITYELLIGGPITYAYRIKLPPGEGRLFRVVPFSREFTINQNQTYTNLPYVALRTKATSSLGVDSMKIWQYYGDTLIDSTGWIPYDTTYFWHLRQDEGANTIYIQYKVDGSIKTPVYSDSIIFDKIAPIGSFVINDDSTFTNTSNVTLKNSFTDSLSSMSRMRFGNKYLKNLVKNSAFDSSGNWEYDTAIYHDSLNLFEIPIQTTGNYFYQSILPESLAEFDNDTMLLWIDLVSDAFVGTGKVEFQYIYGYPRENDTIDPRGQYPFGTTITISQGTNAKVSQYNLASYFRYHPEPPAGEILLEARVRVFIDAGDTNTGKLFIDNFRLDVVSPFDSSRFENYDSLKEWTLTSGNGVRKVYGQFSDGAGNETGVLFDSIVVDTTKPAANISSPQDDQIISGKVGITGWAYDYADPEQHFKLYELKYQKFETEPWYGIDPVSLFYTPVEPSLPPKTLAKWNTQEVTDNHGNGSYYLKLTVRDSAENYQDDTIRVYINNLIRRDGEITEFSHDVYGLAAQDEIYIGEIGTGKIYRYNTNYQMIDTFNLIDSVGIGFPLAMAIDDSGKLWAANITSHFINRFTPQGNLLLQFGSGFSLPSGIGFDNSGNIWVSDRMHHKIKKFNQSGDTLFQFGTKGSEYGEIKRPIGIALLDDKIYIADSRNRRISVFDTLGDFIRVIGESAGLLMPFGLVIDSTGCIFVSDFIGDRVIEFGPSGNQLLEIDSILDAPSGLALSSDANVLYVSDTKHKRVLAFTVRSEPQGGGGPQSHSDICINRLMFDVYPSIFSEQLIIRLQGMGENSKNMEIKIYDVSGRLVKQFNYLTDQPFDQIIWRGQDDLDRQVSCGVYFIRLTVSPVGVIDHNGETPDYIETKKAILLK